MCVITNRSNFLPGGSVVLDHSSIGRAVGITAHHVVHGGFALVLRVLSTASGAVMALHHTVSVCVAIVRVGVPRPRPFGLSRACAFGAVIRSCLVPGETFLERVQLLFQFGCDRIGKVRVLFAVVSCEMCVPATDSASVCGAFAYGIVAAYGGGGGGSAYPIVGS